ncbi:MAG: SDR family NAD(P)-dependent oxidoreductase [Desulfobacterium sp.]|nr:SDR family NAD(P)-dependent oxidoreductase [Desulfobacterium sp.]
MFNVPREVIPHFKENNNGTIINISSAITSADFPCYSLDAATKHAMEGYSCSLSYGLRKANIKVKEILPAGLHRKLHGAFMENSDFEASAECISYIKKVSTNVDDVSEKISSRPLLVAKVGFNAAIAANLKVRSPAGKSSKQLLFMRKFCR